jgi:hypothetical protein
MTLNERVSRFTIRADGSLYDCRVNAEGTELLGVRKTGDAAPGLIGVKIFAKSEGGTLFGIRVREEDGVSRSIKYHLDDFGRYIEREIEPPYSEGAEPQDPEHHFYNQGINFGPISRFSEVYSAMDKRRRSEGAEVVEPVFQATISGTTDELPF